MLAALILGLRVKLRRTQYEQMFSASPLRTDIPQCSRHVRFVPTAEVAVAASSIKSLMPRDGTARHSGSPALRRPSMYSRGQ